MARHSREWYIILAVIGLLACSVVLQGCSEDDDDLRDQPQAQDEEIVDAMESRRQNAMESSKIVHCTSKIHGECPTEFPTFTKSRESSPTCKVAVVGAGASGLYSALRLVDTGKAAGADICVFEATNRVGGRLLSLRGLGPNADLTVDAGGYRTWPQYTPVTHALITEYLGLNAGCYEVVDGKDFNSKDDCAKFNIVDNSDNKVGFSTFVEEMMERLVAAGARYFPLHRLISMNKSSPSANTVLGFSNGAIATASESVFLNIPQRPLLSVLRASELPTGGLDTSTYEALHSVQTEIVSKVYLYYKNAWWYDMGLKNGDIVLDGDATNMPLKGRYHDGDVRCTDDKCHGFLLATYNHDFSGESAMYFRRFQEDRSAPVSIISSSTVEGAMFLKHAHERLVEYHKYNLPANRTDLSAYEVNKILSSAEPPEFAVLSTWNIAVDWAGAGWHHWTSTTYLDKAMEPLNSFGIHVVNEAYSRVQGWAEGALQLADQILEKHFSVSRPWSFAVTDAVQFVAQTKPAPACEEETAAAVADGGADSGGGESPLCFGGDARLRLVNGSTIALSSAKVGMQIWTGEKPGMITEVLEHPVGRIVDVALLQTPEGELLADPDHPVLVEGQWYEIDDALHKGLLQKSSPTLERRFVERFYNLEIDGHMMDGSLHAYVVNGLVVSGLGDNAELNLRFPRQHVFKAKALQTFQVV